MHRSAPASATQVHMGVKSSSSDQSTLPCQYWPEEDQEKEEHENRFLHSQLLMLSTACIPVRMAHPRRAIMKRGTAKGKQDASSTANQLKCSRSQ